ncbi:UDP-N-acetyl-D-mannosamine dehydrogenase [Neptuniibacter sp. QD48_55]|uniref:UDP-N-acetyl-D-mannosamine dehydrogenase n=1 Tax=Neptuniibacter sp. QD48_55 TaxID=3398212 RepID=UPI0039F47F58
MSFKKISVIGLGYIGLPTAAMFASRKVSVNGVDVNAEVVDTINKGGVHIVEPDLEMLVRGSVNAGYLKASLEPEVSDAFLIAVPTPFQDNLEPDLKFVKQAANSIAPFLKKGDLVILESTSPVGTTEKVARWLSEARPDLVVPASNRHEADINIAYCPERVLPGHIVKELVANDRIVGGISDVCVERAIELYRTFVTGDCLKTNARTAEMAKLTENASRDVNIAFANELSLICDKLDIDVWELIELSNRHPRVNILQPGPGVGGHCIAVDPWFIVSSAPEESRLIQTARMVNDAKPEWVLSKIMTECTRFLNNNSSRTMSDLTVSCLGLSFKPDIDDLRESPALAIFTKLVNEFSCRVLACEPNIEVLPASFNSSATLCDIDEAMKEGDIIVLLVDHKEFKLLDLGDIENKYVVDTRGVFR